MGHLAGVRVTEQVGQQDEPHAELELFPGDSTPRCEVVDVHEHGMRVRAPWHGPIPEYGQVVPTATLHCPQRGPLALRGLTVDELEFDQDGLPLLCFSVVDERSRVALWTLLSHDRRSDPEPHPPHSVRVRPIPQRGIYSEPARRARLTYLRRQSGAALESFEETSLRADRLQGNVENLIGGVEVPVGIAGPLLFRGHRAQGVCLAPFATTEGALVSSATRGAIALTRAGGVVTRVIRRELMRVPVFVFTDSEGAQQFCHFASDHLCELREQVRQVSQHARLLHAHAERRGALVTIRFTYDTADAAGQNMTTSTTWHACQWLIRQIAFLEGVQLESFFIESGVSSDKKVSFQSLTMGRGTRVEAECVLPDSVVEDVLKVTADQLVSAFELGLLFGAQTGTIGWNVNVANAVAAIFTATGQDIACVHESSVALLHVRRVPGGVSASLVLPSLVVGTVGGGTHLARQADLLRMMQCAGPGTAARFAEIVAGFCLALDVSTLAALAGGQFATAHERLGRNRPVRWFTRDDLSPGFFEAGVRRALSDPSVEVAHVALEESSTAGHSIITELTAAGLNRLVGLVPAELMLRGSRSSDGRLRVMVKVKPTDREVMLMAQRVATMCGGRLAGSYAEFKDRVGLDGCHLRELAVYEQTDPRFLAYTPRVYRTFRDEAREAYVIAMEDLSGADMLDPARSPDASSRRYIEAAIRGAASLHAIWYGREDELRRRPWLGHVMTTADMVDMRELWTDLAVHGANEFPEWFVGSDLDVRLQLIDTLASWWPALEAAPRTLIHNDFNPRNLAFRREPAGLRLAAYDWELATIGLPQHDLADLLCYMLPSDVSREEVDHWVERHRVELEKATGGAIATDTWRAGFRASVFDLALNRAALTTAVHTFRHYPFMERVHATLRRLVVLQDLP